MTYTVTDENLNSLTSIIITSIHFNSETSVTTPIMPFRIYSQKSCFKRPFKVVVFHAVCIFISSKCLKAEIKLDIHL